MKNDEEWIDEILWNFIVLKGGNRKVDSPQSKEQAKAAILDKLNQAVAEARVECMEYAKKLCTVNFDRTGLDLAVTFGTRIAELTSLRQETKEKP